ncbi:hypothetical protein ACHAW6_013199 [Cyclotella cf. meneghiniana]
MPDDFIAIYNLNQLITTDRYIFVLIQKGMYGLPQAGIIAQQLLEQCLIKNAFNKAPSLQVSGNMTGILSPSPSVLMILESSRLASNMYNT